MKKLLLTLSIILLASTICQAEPIRLKEALGKLPNLQNGVAYDFVESKFNYIGTFEVAKYKGASFEFGYAGQSEPGDKLVGVLSYDLLALGDYVDFPILKYVHFQPGIWAGFAPSSDILETSWGISVSLLSFDF